MYLCLCRRGRREPVQRWLRDVRGEGLRLDGLAVGASFAESGADGTATEVETVLGSTGVPTLRGIARGVCPARMWLACGRDSDVEGVDGYGRGC